VVERLDERRSQLLNRCSEVVDVLEAVFGGGGVIGFEVRGPVKLRAGGYREKLGARRRAGVLLEGGLGSGLFSGVLKADPMSDRVSERTCMRIVGAK
jgi:hypothetical protein